MLMSRIIIFDKLYLHSSHEEEGILHNTCIHFNICIFKKSITFQHFFSSDISALEVFNCKKCPDTKIPIIPLKLLTHFLASFSHYNCCHAFVVI